jgi:hypothetical protein
MLLENLLLRLGRHGLVNGRKDRHVRSLQIWQKTKKADVAEHPKAFGHVGLLFNKPPGIAGMFFV